MNKDFVEVANNSGSNNGSFDVVCGQNSGNERSTILTVSGGGVSKTVAVKQAPNPYIYIDCGYIFSNANIQEPYKLTNEGFITVLTFDVKFANFISSSRGLFIIKNVSSLQVEFNNPVISSINMSSDNQPFGNIALDGFTTKVVPNSEDEGTVLSIIDITPAKLNEIVATINSARDASTTGGIEIAIAIRTTGTHDNLLIMINVI